MEVDGLMREGEVRTAKRQKLTNGTAKTQRKPGTSRIFAPYRTIGLVSPTSVPFASLPLGKTTFQITTSVGRSLQTYDLRRGLNLVFITRPQTPETITASAAWKDKVFAAWGGDGPDATQRGVWMFQRGKKEAELEMPTGWRENVKRFCIFGSWIVGVCETQMLVWKTANLEMYTTLQGISPIPFTDCMASLPTFLNKIIVGRHDGSSEIWNVAAARLIYTILPPSTAYGAVTAIEPTPALCLVAIAYEKGPLVIHDIRTDQTVIQLRLPTGAPVTSISFRTDGLGAGDDGTKAGVMATASVHSGDITLWDLNDGARRSGVLRSAHAHPTTTTRQAGGNGGVSKIEFLPGQAVLVSSGRDNRLQTWLCDATPFSPIPRILHSRSGHGAPVTNLHFLPSASDGSDETGKWLMSGSRDRSLWGWSLRRDGQSTELSQGAVRKKAKKHGLMSSSADRDATQDLKCPPIIAVACSLNRDGGIGAVPGKHPIWQNGKGSKGKQVSAEVSAMTGWESVVTAHEKDRKARTWFWGRKRAGRWAFETGDGGDVSTVAMSPCGTFALVGSDTGGIDMFNLQSGMHRRRFPARLTPMQAKQLKVEIERQGEALVEDSEDGKNKFYRGMGRHGSAVVGLAVDGLNKTMVSAGANGKVKFWDFGTGLLKHEIDWSTSTGIKGMRFHRSSDLAAFACTDGCVRVIDIATSKLVRELWPSRPAVPELRGLAVTDFVFSNDEQWIAACMGALVLLWDLPTGHLVDTFRLKATCTSLAFSPTGEFLATATVDSVGVDVWSNRALFMHVPRRRIGPEELKEIVASGDAPQVPTASGEGGQAMIAVGDGDYEREEEEDEEDSMGEGEHSMDVDLLSSDLLSLSLVPRSRWQNLLHLDLIRQRNKPTEPPRKPEKAPFFLPSLQQNQQTNAGSAADTSAGARDTEVEKERSRIAKLTPREGGAQQSRFSSLLHSASESEEAFAPFLDHLKSLNPAAADIEIRSLRPGDSGEMLTFVRSLAWLLGQRRDFELGQAWMAVFLRVHGDFVMEDEELREEVNVWAKALEEERRRVQRLAGYVRGVVGYLRAAGV